MKGRYNHHEIEKRGARKWQKAKIAETNLKAAKDKFYCLDMFPYPSGEGLHVGHWRGYVLSDFYARYHRLNGKNVLHPMGFDAFGLPAENAAIKHKAHPKQFTDKAVKLFRGQLDKIGALYDWSKLINTSTPEYYRWTQWLFLQLYKHGLAEKRLAAVNWCPKDKTVLANEQVVNGLCERCGTKVTKKELEQWYLKITEFADELLEGLEDLEWPSHVKQLQRNWIGKSEGIEVSFHTPSRPILVFTTRLDTIFGATALVLAPEHKAVLSLTKPEYQAAVGRYVEQTKNRSAIERQQLAGEAKTGVFTGNYTMHPLTHKELPIWVADYVLPDYGTGAIMAVPAHDERDYSFAKSHSLPIYQVVEIPNGTVPFSDPGVLVNSGEFNGLTSVAATTKITARLEKRGLGRVKTGYRLRDWLVSRQRYWGAPIPIVYDPSGEPHPVKEKDLPLLLPDDVDFRPGGVSPIARSKEYQKRAERLYGKGWRFETDTLDTFVDSSWYYLRYLSPTDKKQAFDRKLVAQWLPVDLYVGGIEHAILHLLYARFVCRFLATYGYIDKAQAEPFGRLFNIGMVTLRGAKMSKSKGNVVAPDDLIEHYGTDALRGYELFVGPAADEAEWTTRGINGIHRFLIKLVDLQPRVKSVVNYEQRRLFDLYLANIETMIGSFRLNTVISEAMKLANELGKAKVVDRELWRRFVVTLGPLFPFLAEEIWSKESGRLLLGSARWPSQFGNKKATAKLKVLLNQRFIGEIDDPLAGEDKLVRLVTHQTYFKQRLGSRQIERVIYKPGELLNLITG